MLRQTCYIIAFAVSFAAKGQLLEAERGERSGTEIASARTGYTGDGYVTGFDGNGDRVTVRTYVSRGVYEVYIRYASVYGDKYNLLNVNDRNAGSVLFPVTTGFAETLAGKVFLDKGENHISIVKDWGYIDVDNFRVVRSQPSEIAHVSLNLVTPSPSPPADSLYRFLMSLYGKVMLSGQYGGAPEFDRILSLTGKVPVIRGFDLIDYSPSRVERGATSTETEVALAWHGQGGITTVMWHWNAPKDLIDQPGKEWWRGFYTEATDFDLQKAMADENSDEYALLIRDIDVIAVQLRKLADAGVPVLWRPLHEAEGGWFWWGAKGPEPLKWLWRLMFERLTGYHDLHNLIWVWTSSTSHVAPEWYPGDAYVDMIGADLYLPDGSYSSSFVSFDRLAATFGGRKMIAMSENGGMPDAERAFIEGASWSWFATWSGAFVTNTSKNSPEHIIDVYTHDFVITLDEIQNLSSIIADLDERRELLIDDGEITGIAETRTPSPVFSNPVRDAVVITLSDDGPVLMQLTDMGGRLVLNSSSRYGPLHVLDVATLSRGIYLLKVVTRFGVHNLRLLKQ